MKKYLIALDDGHGMNTSGKRTPIFTDGTISKETGKSFMHENEFNKAVVKYLDELLKYNGFDTVLTAPTDEDTPLKDRVRLANSRKADIYVSVHANAYLGKWGNWGGESTFSIRSDISNHERYKKSKKLAAIIHKNLMMGTKLRDRGTKESGFYVLKYTNMPSILVECAFMDNETEARLLMIDSFRKETAIDLARGICDYFNVPFEKPSEPSPIEPQCSVLEYKTSLKKGAKGVEVRILQEILLHLGYDLGSWGADGSFGLATEKVVKQFQADHGLIVDGIAGKMTYIKINEVSANDGINPSSRYKTIKKFDSTIHIYETGDDEFVDIELGQSRKLEPLSKIAKEGKEIVCKINAGFFSFDGTSEHLGMYIDEGLYYTPPSSTFIDFIYLKDGHTEINNLDGYDGWALSQLQAKSYWAIGTSYALVIKGEINLMNKEKFKHHKYKHPRTLLGQRTNGTFALVVADGRSANSKGLTAEESAIIMKELGCYNAVNLDGGGSSEMIVNNKIVNKPSDGKERFIGSAVVVYKK